MISPMSLTTFLMCVPESAKPIKPARILMFVAFVDWQESHGQDNPRTGSSPRPSKLASQTKQASRNPVSIEPGDYSSGVASHTVFRDANDNWASDEGGSSVGADHR